MCKDGGGAAAEVAACFRQAAELYKQAGRGQTAADSLCRGGKAVEAMEVSVGCALYMEAVAVYEEEDKQLYSQDAFRQAVVLQVGVRRVHAQLPPGGVQGLRACPHAQPGCPIRRAPTATARQLHSLIHLPQEGVCERERERERERACVWVWVWVCFCVEQPHGYACVTDGAATPTPK